MRSSDFYKGAQSEPLEIFDTKQLIDTPTTHAISKKMLSIIK
ncbi:hypothetical protein M153_11200010655 [Pseudoloma neurophilia]|uniref:Uncharacterized protein n=1 Tax=Pseudoloma neurophilia TaxID=146866 RepID=A0A0R0M9C7_9MICR|nr:hypothetical protein M153_11200010655 [Pseudoloma neurophilia]